MEQIQYVLITSNKDLPETKPVCDTHIGLDIETTGLNLNTDKLVGLSFWIEGDPKAYFVTKEVLDSDSNIKLWLKTLFETNIVICHNSPFDINFLQREGFVFNTIYDTLIMCNLLQFHSSKLKDVALEMGVVEYEQVIYIQDLFKEKGIKEDEVLDFSKLDLTDQRVLQYVCNDAIFPVKLYPILFDMFVNNMGLTPEMTKENLMNQFVANKALLEWNKEGLEIDRSVLQNSINSFEQDYNQNKEILTKEVRKLIEDHLGIDNTQPKQACLFV